MKGKLFKANSPAAKNEIIEYFLQRPKPWLKNEAKIYTWKSSIPPKWIDLKGEEFFKHTSEVKEPKLSIELLQNSKRYVHELKINSQKEIVRPVSVKIAESPANPATGSSKQHKKRFSLSYRRSQDKNLSVAGSSTPLILSIDSRPVTKEARCASAGYEEPSKVMDFLRRFEKQRTIKEHPPANKAMFGWKLRSVRSKSRDRRSSYCQIFNVKKNSEKILHSVCTKRMHSIQL